jgi:DNA polymerase III delta prime subunit
MSEKLEIHENIKIKLNTFLKNNSVPHILFYGPHGAGKKTLVNDFIKEIYPNKHEYKQNVMSINCALGKGIQFIREDIKQFAKSHSFSKNNFKTILLYNADRLTVDAQSALRRCIEVFSNSTRFFVIVESKQQLLRPILSRFCDIYVYFPIINEHPTNLNLHVKTITYSNEYLKFIKNRNAQFNRIICKCSESDTDLFKIVEDLYNKGYSCHNIINYYKVSHNVKMFYYSIKTFYKNEKLLMYYILFILFRNKDDLEILSLIR